LDKKDNQWTDAQREQMTVCLRLMYVMLQRRNDAVREIPGMAAPQQEYWKHQLQTLAILLDESGVPVQSRRAAIAVRDLRAAVNQLSSGSTLDLKNLAFCNKVDGFGTTSEFPKYEFKGDQEVLLYVEIDNFTVETKSQIRRSEAYETEFRANYQILDGSGHRVAEQDLPPDKQTCRSPRRDYFIAYRLYIPKRIDPGAYTLQLTMEDVKGNKFGQASIEFKVRD